MCELYTFCTIFYNSHYLIDYQKVTNNNYVIRRRIGKHTMQCLWVANMEYTILRLNVKRMCFFIRGVFTKYVLLEKKLSKFGCSMHQDGREVMNVHQLANQSLNMQLMINIPCKYISYTYVINFFVGFFVACVFLIVISSLTEVVEMCYKYQCLVMYFSQCSQVLCDYYYQLC